MSIQTASEEKLSLMSSLAKTWGKVYSLPESHDDRWVGMQPEVEGGTAAVERIEDGVRRLDHREPGDTTKNASSDVQKAAVKLSGHLIAGTDIADSAMRQAGVDQHDAEVAQSWTEALQFVDAFCRESQRRIEGVKQDAHADTGGEENVWHLGMAAGSLDTAAQVARQQYERGIRMSLQGPLAEYAAASAVEMGLTHSPSEGLNPTDGAVYGMYRAMHQQCAIIERLPDLQLTAIPIDPADKPELSNGLLVAYTANGHGAYVRRDPAKFAEECRIKSGKLRERAAHQDDSGAYRELMDEAVHWTILSAAPQAMDTVTERMLAQNAREPDITTPVRTREEIVSGAVAQMNRALGYADKPASPTVSTDGVAFHLDARNAVIWDEPREAVRLASAGYSVLPVIHYGQGAAPWICMDGEQPTNLMVEHHGKSVVEFPATAMADAMAYVDDAKAAENLEAITRQQRLEHAFHLGLLEQLGNSDVRGPEVDEARNNGLSATVLSVVRDANQNAFAIVEADASEIPATGSARARHRLFAIPVADEDVEHLPVGEQASFLMLEWREHCTVLKQPDQSVNAVGRETPIARQATEAVLGL